MQTIIKAIEYSICEIYSARYSSETVFCFKQMFNGVHTDVHLDFQVITDV